MKFRGADAGSPRGARQGPAAAAAAAEAPVGVATRSMTILSEAPPWSRRLQRRLADPIHGGAGRAPRHDHVGVMPDNTENAS